MAISNVTLTAEIATSLALLTMTGCDEIATVASLPRDDCIASLRGNEVTEAISSPTIARQEVEIAASLATFVLRNDGD